MGNVALGQRPARGKPTVPTLARVYLTIHAVRTKRYVVPEKIYQIMVPSTDSGDVFMCDGIDYKGGIWIVPYWINNPATGLRTPTRIVRVDLLGLQTGWQQFGADYAVPTMKLPTAVLEGRAQPEAPIELIESPPISFPIPGYDRHH